MEDRLELVEVPVKGVRATILRYQHGGPQTVASNIALATWIDLKRRIETNES